MICIYDKLSTDFSTNGLGALAPTECTVSETLNGRWEIRLEHPYDAWGKWQRLAQGRILRAPVPAAMTPRVELTASTATSREIWKVDTSSSRLHLRSGPGTKYKILGKYKKGTKVILLSADNADWYEVTAPDGKRGYMYAEYLAYVRTETTGSTAKAEVIEARQLRDQPFRIYRVIPTLEGITVHARHLSYDLLDNMIRSYTAKSSTAGAAVFSAIGSKCATEHEFNFYSDLTSTAEEFKIENKNPMEAILGDAGAADSYGGELSRDWLDLYLVERVGSDTGVQIREGKNLLGIEYDEDHTDVCTRIMPTGTDADGNVLYLPEVYIDSDRIGDYAHPKWVHLAVGDAKEVTSGDEKRTKSQCYTLMRKAANEKLTDGCDLPKVTVKVDFVNLADTEEYADYLPLQSICLGDTVHVHSSALGRLIGVRMVEYEYDALNRKYTKMTLGSAAETVSSSGISARQISSGSITALKLAMDSVGSGQLQSGSVGSLQIGAAAVGIAHIAEACITELNAQAVTALTAKINEIAAGSITTDELYASLAQIVTLMVQSITADTIDTDELYAALADVILLRAEQINAESISADALAAQYAEIVALLVESLTAESIEADHLAAALAGFVSMYASVGEFDFATIQNLVAGAMALEQGSAESVYIKNLAVTSANLLSATLGKLVLKGDDGGYYRVFIGADGEISTEAVELTEDEITAGQTSGGQEIVETNLNVADLNASNLQASSAVINEILTTALTAEKITAADAMIASATIPTLYATTIKAIGEGIDLSSNQYIVSIVESVSEAQAAADNAQSTAEHALIEQSVLAPENPSDDMLWLDLSASPSVLKRWDGAAWQEVSPTDELWQEVALNSTEIRQLAQEIALKVNQGDLETYLQLTGEGVIVGRSDSAYRVYIENGGYHVQQYGENIMSLHKRTAYIPYMRYGTMEKSSYIADTISADGGIMTVRIDN